MTQAPERIWINYAAANKVDLAYDDPPITSFDDVSQEYVRADLAQAPAPVRVKPEDVEYSAYEAAKWFASFEDIDGLPDCYQPRAVAVAMYRAECAIKAQCLPVGRTAALARHLAPGDDLVERIAEPHDPGAFVGDIYYGHPVKTTMGTHRWTGSEWVALPSAAEALAELLADARTENARLRARLARMEGAGDGISEAITQKALAHMADGRDEAASALKQLAEVIAPAIAALTDGGSNE